MLSSSHPLMPGWKWELTQNHLFESGDCQPHGSALALGEDYFWSYPPPNSLPDQFLSFHCPSLVHTVKWSVPLLLSFVSTITAWPQSLKCGCSHSVAHHCSRTAYCCTTLGWKRPLLIRLSDELESSRSFWQPRNMGFILSQPCTS